MSILDTAPPPPAADTRPDLPPHMAAALSPDHHDVWNTALEIARALAGIGTEPDLDGENEPVEAPGEAEPEDRAPEELEPVETEPHGAAAEEPGPEGESGEESEEPAAPGPGLAAAPASPGSSGSLVGVSPARPGELQDKVATLLADHPGREFTVTEVAKDLGHSGGAVGNALKTLAADGRITETSTSPRRYAARTPDPYRPAPVARAPLPPRTPATTTSATPPPPAPGMSAPAAPGTRSAPAAPAPDPRAPIRRRNGQYYYPRRLGEYTDVQVLHALRAAGISALLEGPPGTGKTSLAEAAFPDLVLIAGDGDTQVADLVGSYTIAEDGSYAWNYGPLVVAMREGRPLFIDDATLISPKVLAVMYPAMDGRREIAVKEHTGETVTAKDGFYVIAGHNPHVHGAVLTDALASRFTAPIQVSTDYELAETLGVHRKAVQIARNLASQQRTGASGWAPQMRELLAFRTIATVLGEDAAFGNMIGQAPLDDRDTVAMVIATILGRKVAPLALGPQAR